MSKPGNEDAERLIVPFSEIDPRSLSEYGGKGANLGALIQNEFTVPDGFCVTTNAYYSLLTDEIRETIRSLDEIDSTDQAELSQRSQQIRQFFRERELPTELRERVRDAISSRETTSYAVRSSATAEDLPSASFAGQHETYLGVEPDDVDDRIRDCMASLFTERAVMYRSQNTISHADVGLAVVVQTMVDADAAGVLFTADPDTGNRTVTSIDAALGLGDTVVAGEVDVDNARVNKSTGEVLSYDVGTQQEQLTITDNETEHISLSTSAGSARVLSDAQLAELMEVGRQVESLFEAPQDIEWAFVDDELVVLQSRPITSLFPLPDPMPRDDRLHMYLSMGHTQAMAEAMPPLAVDLWRELMEDTFAEFDPDENSQWVVEAGGRVYFDITPFLQFKRGQQSFIDSISSLSSPAATGLKELIDRRGREFEDTVSIVSILTTVRNTGKITLTIIPVLPSVLIRFIVSFFRAGDDREQVVRWYEAWGEQMATEILAPEDVTEKTQSVFKTYSSQIIEIMKGVYPHVMPLFAGIAADKGLRILFPDEQDTIDAAGRGFRDEVGTQMNLRLNDLADIARDHPPIAEALRSEESLDSIEAASGGDEFVDELESFLDEFGHRTSGEIDVSRPRWRDNPGGLLQVIRGNLLAGEHDTYREHLRELEDEAAVAVADLTEKAGHGLFGPIRQRVVSRLLKVYRGYISLRDEPKHGTAHLFAAWHEGLQQAGEHLAERNQLETPADVWYLRKDELFELLASREAPIPDIDGRRRDHERFKRLDAPPLLTSEGEAPTAAVAHDFGEDTLVGTGVSSGIVEGTARVVFDPSETTLEPGEILVAPSCDPGWTPLFLNAAGLVTDVGGRMTHGALVAREYGLPGVMSIRNATSRIETGQRIRVDGSQGTVELLEEE